MIVVCDTSTISNLLQIGLIEVLHNIFGQLIIPPAVKRELYRLPSQEIAIANIDWISTKAPRDQKMILNLLEDLDLGEAESITLAYEDKADYLLMDEYKGREIASIYGLKVVGILGILIKAKQMGEIRSVKSKINDLIDIGFRLNRELIKKVLKDIGE